MPNILMKYICINWPPILKGLFFGAMLAIPVSVLSVESNANRVRKELCALYEITLPTHWIRESSFAVSGMPPVRGALLFDAAGSETKCHLCYQSWQFFDKNHFENAESCHIRSYILPDGGKVDIELLKTMLDRQNSHPGSWKKIDHGYMKSADAENEGFKVGAAGLEKVVTYDRFIDVLLEGSDYVHHLSIIVPEDRYRSDEKFRQVIDIIWKNWRLKK